MYIKHRPELLRQISRAIKLDKSEEFPMTIFFNAGMECAEFKITIQRSETDVFVDAKGQKWKKVE